MAKIFFYLLVVPVYILSLIPLRGFYIISDLIAFVMERVVRYRASVVYINLSRSFPEKSYSELRKIAHKNYKYITDNFVETIWAVTASEKQLSKRARIVNPEVLADIYETGKSAMVVMGHTGNWELLGSFDFYAHKGALGFGNEHVRFLYKRSKNKTMDMLTYWIRDRHDLATLVESHGAPKFILKSRHQKNLYFLIADQSPHPGSKYSVDFLNQPTMMLNGPEQLSKLMDLSVVYLGMEKIARGKYEIRFTKITENPKGEPDGFITARYAQLLEQDIIKNPSAWLWSHKRWKRTREEINQSTKIEKNG